MKNPLYWAMLVGMTVLLMEQGKCWIWMFLLRVLLCALFLLTHLLLLLGVESCSRRRVAFFFLLSLPSFLFHACTFATLFAHLSGSLNKRLVKCSWAIPGSWLVSKHPNDLIWMYFFLHLFLFVSSSSCQSSFWQKMPSISSQLVLLWFLPKWLLRCAFLFVTRPF